MGTQQSRSGHGREGSRQQSQQSDQRPATGPRSATQQAKRSRGAATAGRRQATRRSAESQQQGQPRNPAEPARRRPRFRPQDGERRSRAEPRAAERAPADEPDGRAWRRQLCGVAPVQRCDAQVHPVRPRRTGRARRSPALGRDAREMDAAEAEGKRHAKGEDPALDRTSSQPVARNRRARRDRARTRSERCAPHLHDPVAVQLNSIPLLDASSLPSGRRLGAARVDQRAHGCARAISSRISIASGAFA